MASMARAAVVRGAAAMAKVEVVTEGEESAAARVVAARVVAEKVH